VNHYDLLYPEEMRNRLEMLDEERDTFMEETGIDEVGDPTAWDQALSIWETQQPDGAEWRQLTDILDEVGDASELISDRHFHVYIRDQLTDCGDVPKDFPWYIEIDWKATADNCRSDYDEIEIEGHTYLYRD